MRAEPGQPATRPGGEGALQVRLIERPPPAPPALPAMAMPPSAKAPLARPARPRREAPARGAMQATLPAASASAAPVPRLFDRTGQPLLPPPASAATAPATGYVAHRPRDSDRVMTHDSPLPYRPTRFESAFPDRDESALGEGVRTLLRKTHTGEEHRVDLPGGVHLRCKTLLGIPTPDCAMPPAPPSKKDGDERLDMAPARPLASGLAPAPHALADCIARYRSGRPLPHGCPVDTPARAVDAECAEAERAGKPQPAHCAGADRRPPSGR